jgi:hypothetical protein
MELAQSMTQALSHRFNGVKAAIREMFFSQIIPKMFDRI